MEEDQERTARARQELGSAALAGIICQRNDHVLMLTGYAPVLGQSFVVFPAAGEPTLIVPEAEEGFARAGWCPDVRTYEAGTLQRNADVGEAVEPILAEACRQCGLDRGDVGYEAALGLVPSSYTQVGYPSAGTREMYVRALGHDRLLDVSPLLSLLGATLTPAEQARLVAPNALARAGLEAGRRVVRPGISEAEVAATVESAARLAGGNAVAHRVRAFAHVMSGSRAALAYQAFNLTNERIIQPADPVLIQLEVYVDGFWAETTRTFFAGEPGAEGRRIYEACFAAQQRAFAAIRHGAAAAEVDAAARQYLDGDGFGAFFRHGTGHGVGFQAISHRQPPRLRPDSTDTLQTGMVFNVEPGVYVHGWGGVRINDTAVCQPEGIQILTQIPRDLSWAIVQPLARKTSSGS